MPLPGFWYVANYKYDTDLHILYTMYANLKGVNTWSQNIEWLTN